MEPQVERAPLKRPKLAGSPRASGAVLTTVGLVALMLLASYVMEFSVSLYARDYGGFGVVLAIYFWILLSSAGRRAFRRPLRSGAFSDEAGQRRDPPAHAITQAAWLGARAALIDRCLSG
jgi:hypothetical protein